MVRSGDAMGSNAGITCATAWTFGNSYAVDPSPNSGNSSPGALLTIPISWLASRFPAVVGWGVISVPERACEVNWNALTFPSPSSPATRSYAVGLPLAPHAVISARIHCTRTGLPTSWESSTASPATSSYPGRPYDPASSTQITCTRSFDTCSSSATPICKECGFCPPDQIVVTPSACTSAMAQPGPIVACAWKGQS